jgi:hypothetical protein
MDLWSEDQRSHGCSGLLSELGERKRQPCVEYSVLPIGCFIVGSTVGSNSPSGNVGGLAGSVSDGKLQNDSHLSKMRHKGPTREGPPALPNDNRGMLAPLLRDLPSKNQPRFMLLW